MHAVEGPFQVVLGPAHVEMSAKVQVGAPAADEEPWPRKSSLTEASVIGAEFTPTKRPKKP